MNKILINGRIVGALHPKVTDKGQVWMPFRLKNTHRGRDGKDHFVTVGCVAFGKCAQFIAEQFQENSPIMIHGKLNYRSYKTADGVMGDRLEILVSSYDAPNAGYGENNA